MWVLAALTGPSLTTISVSYLTSPSPPQDITITDGRGEVTFVEVKTTTSLTKPFFEVSLPELIFAQRAGAAYHLYRVSGGGTADVSLACMPDPVRCVSSGLGSLALVFGNGKAPGAT